MSGEIAKKIEALTGWKPPICYDINTDSYRLATQADFDLMAKAANAYSRLSAKLRGVLDEEKLP